MRQDYAHLINPQSNTIVAFGSGFWIRGINGIFFEEANERSVKVNRERQKQLIEGCSGLSLKKRIQLIIIFYIMNLRIDYVKTLNYYVLFPI